MLDQYFYFESIRNTSIAVLDLFNNIHVHELDRQGNVENDITVPIAMARRQKYLSRLREEHKKIEQDRDVAHAGIQLSLPRLSLEITDLQPDPSRQLNALNSCINRVTQNNVSQYLQQREGIPLNVTYSLTAWTRTIDQMFQIFEQMLAYMVPEFTLKVNQVPEMGVVRDVPLRFDNVSINDLFDGVLQEELNTYQWSFSFSAETYIYPPITDNAGVIKRAITNFRQNDDFIYERVTLEVDPFEAEKNEPHIIVKTIEDDIND